MLPAESLALDYAPSHVLLITLPFPPVNQHARQPWAESGIISRAVLGLFGRHGGNFIHLILLAALIVIIPFSLQAPNARMPGSMAAPGEVGQESPAPNAPMLWGPGCFARMGQ